MNKRFKLLKGNNLETLKTIPDNSIDSIVTDPPYGLSFMNKKWDYDVPSVDFWKEVYRVLKPGGYILSFGGTRTYHRMVVNIEDAGFEIRDQIMWIYGSGFPKSLNIGKEYDKKVGNEREVVKTKTGQGNIKGKSFDLQFDREPIEVNITKGNSPYEGWGTALKPANEPICVARKPISEKTVVDNVIKWGVGGINVDGCRIGSEGGTKAINFGDNIGNVYGNGKGKPTNDIENLNEGRFPANIIFDEKAAELLDKQSGMSKSNPRKKPLNSKKEPTTYNTKEGGESNLSDSGGASRFFYVAKVSKKERNLGLDSFEDKTSQLNSGGIGRKISVEKRLDENGENAPTQKNHHPTLKPINLMTYLCRLVTPENGIVLDLFMGSGSTGIAAMLEGFRFVGCEMDEEYFKIAETRIQKYEEYRKLLK